MRDQVNGKREQVVEAAVPPTTSTLPTVEIIEIQAFQPPQLETPVGIGRPGQAFTGLINAEEPFALEVTFNLIDPAAADVAQRQMSYQAQFYTRSIVTGAKSHLGDTVTDTLVEGQLVYKARLPEATLPPGNYRLQTLIIFPSLATMPGLFEIPLLQVI